MAVSREDDENIVSLKSFNKILTFTSSHFEIRKWSKNYQNISFKNKSFSHVINHKNISSILKFWKLIHVIPTILKRSCLVLSYFEQDIKIAVGVMRNFELIFFFNFRILNFFEKFEIL